MNADDLLSISKLLLPEVLVDYFELYQQEAKDEEIRFFFREQNIHPKEGLTSKGFFPETIIQDFPIRGKQVYLHVIRRRWYDPKTSSVVTRDWELVAKGARMTDEFASFLKEINKQ